MIGRGTGLRGAVLVAVLTTVLTAALTACTGAAATPPPPSGAAGDFAQAVDVGGRSVYVECHGTNAPGRHTVVLISGYHDSGDAWSID
ncbi:hypothetical protein ACR9E3_18335 [Actinomycetospora sp. C-140]